MMQIFLYHFDSKTTNFINPGVFEKLNDFKTSFICWFTYGIECCYVIYHWTKYDHS